MLAPDYPGRMTTHRAQLRLYLTPSKSHSTILCATDYDVTMYGRVLSCQLNVTERPVESWQLQSCAKILKKISVVLCAHHKHLHSPLLKKITAHPSETVKKIGSSGTLLTLSQLLFVRPCGSDVTHASNQCFKAVVASPAYLPHGTTASCRLSV